MTSLVLAYRDVTNVDLSILGDIQIPIPLPQGMSLYRVAEIAVGRPSRLPDTAEVGVYTAAAQGGTNIAPQQALSSITTTSANTAGNSMTLVLNAATTTTFNVSSLFFNVGMVNGVPMTVDVLIVICAPSPKISGIKWQIPTTSSIRSGLGRVRMCSRLAYGPPTRLGRRAFRPG